MLHAAGTGRCPTARRLSALWIGTRLRLHSAETGVAPDRARTAWSAGRGIGGQTWPARGPRGYCWTCRSGVEVWGGVQGHAGHADRVRPAAEATWVPVCVVCVGPCENLDGWLGGSDWNHWAAFRLRRDGTRLRAPGGGHVRRSRPVELEATRNAVHWFVC